MRLCVCVVAGVCVAISGITNLSTTLLSQLLEPGCWLQDRREGASSRCLKVCIGHRSPDVGRIWVFRGQGADVGSDLVRKERA